MYYCLYNSDSLVHINGKCFVFVRCWVYAICSFAFEVIRLNANPNAVSCTA